MKSHRIAVEVRGLVQGVGFRPFVYRMATRHDLRGWVRNTSEKVELEVQGESEAVASFLQDLEFSAPGASRIDSFVVRDVPCEDVDAADFEILSSPSASSVAPVLPADLATCEDCARELRDPSDPRFGYPFLNCTHCGPRWTIVRGLPYDRPRTSMAGFPFCDFCQEEYRDPGNRRFHAQPVACPECGPHLSVAGLSLPVDPREADAACLAAAVSALKEGKILALKGLGGVQLLVDAGNQAAVERLRARKRRPAKPFAVMVPDLAWAQRLVRLDEGVREALRSAEAPIVLLPRVPGESPEPVAASVSPDNPWLGIFLPYTPLHHLLMVAFGAPLICTSGNLSEEPMCTEEAEARSKLGEVADLFLMHDRPIVRPVDDSVVRVRGERVEVLRRARGYCPRPLLLKRDVDGILALGAHLKNTCALGLGSQAVISPHIGDLDSGQAVDLLERTVRDLLAFFQVKPRKIVCDLHPDYASTRLAEELAREFGASLLQVQHHHAHVAAALAELAEEGPVLGLAWDGVGLGSDGTAWGGEALLVDGKSFRRFGALRGFPLPGGDVAAREPRRAALGLLLESGEGELSAALGGLFRPSELELLARFAARPGAPHTSSMGRLFDGVAALMGLPPVCTFEGQAAQQLEFAAGYGGRPSELEELLEQGIQQEVSLVREGDLLVGDWAPLVAWLRNARERGKGIAERSRHFHDAVSHWAVAWATAAQEEVPGLRGVALVGGCFQNRLLVDLVEARLQREGIQVFVPGSLPPGDGAISLGQLWVAGAF